MACNNLGLFSSGSTACNEVPSFELYGDSLTIGEFLYLDSGCTIEVSSESYSDGVNLIEYKESPAGIMSIDPCDVGVCPLQYCISGTGIFDGQYNIGPSNHNGYVYYTGDTSPTYYIYYNTGVTSSWCLSDSLDGPCSLFGKSPCLSDCPDLCDEFFFSGVCPTTTTTTTVTPTTTTTTTIAPTTTTTTTITPTTTTTTTVIPDLCSGITMVVSGITYPIDPVTPTTTTTTTLPPVVRPCNFDGVVTFNTLSGRIQCANSKKFVDCFTGEEYYTTSPVFDSSGNTIVVGYVYGGFVNGVSKCFSYFGLVENISGIDNVVITDEYGFLNDGACLLCTVDTGTTTTTTTASPTTTTTTTLSCISYKVKNNSFVPRNYEYTDCDSGETVVSLINGNSTITICSLTVPTGQNITASGGSFC